MEQSRLAKSPPGSCRLYLAFPSSDNLATLSAGMADLLSILRGTAPAPAAPSTTRTSSSTSIPTSADPPQLARHDSSASVMSTAPPEMSSGRGQGAPNPLEQLLRTFSQPRPASSDPSNAATSAALHSDGVQQSRAQGQGPLSPTSGTRPSASDSAALLSLLKGNSSSGITSPVPARPAASPLLSPRGGNAKDLLGLLMGGSGPVTPASEAAPIAAVQQPAQESPKAQAAPQVKDVVDMLGLLGMQDAPSEPAPTDSQPAPATSGGPPLPVFTFVSPFDFLESTRSPPPAAQAPQQAEKQTGTSAGEPFLPAAASPQPQQAARTVSSAAARRPLDSAQGAASPVSVASTSDISKAPDSASGHDGNSAAFPQDFLASEYLRSVPVPAPSWAPLGVRLPRRASLPYNAPQHLTISTADPHLEALVPTAPHVTPIALFPVPVAERRSLARRRTAGIWDQGIAYGSAGTGKNRMRVIDRESGAKVLLKGKKEEKEVVELQVEGQSFGDMRRIACVGKEGRLSVWQVPNRFDDESAASQQYVRVVAPHCVSSRCSQTHIITRSIRLLNLANAAAPFVLARFVPGQQSLYAVRSDRVLAVYNLTNTAAKPKEIRLIGGGEIVDIAFSPDAAYAAVLTSKSIVTFQLDNSSAQKKTDLVDLLGDGAAGEADQIVFVSPANDADIDSDAQAWPIGLAVSSAFGTKISVLPIQSQSGRLSMAPTPTVQIEVTPPPPSDVEQFLFGQLEYHEKTQSLVVSHSLRGSLFTFRLAFVDGPDGEPVIRINHVLEHPTPAPILSFTLDSLPTADPNSETTDENDLPEGVRAASKIRYGALAVHPGGVHHVALIADQPRHYAETAPKHRSHDSDTSSDGEGMARRMSLEGSIHVSSEVEVTVEEIDIVEVDLGANGVVIEENGVQTVLITASSVDEPDETPTTAEGTPRYPLTAIPSVQSSPRGTAEPALGDLSNGIAAVATPIAELLREDVLPVRTPASDATRDTSDLTAADFAERSSAMPRATTGASNNDLATMIAAVVQQELQKQGGPDGLDEPGSSCRRFPANTSGSAQVARQGHLTASWRRWSRGWQAPSRLRYSFRRPLQSLQSLPRYSR